MHTGVPGAYDREVLADMVRNGVQLLREAQEAGQFEANSKVDVLATYAIEIAPEGYYMEWEVYFAESITPSPYEPKAVVVAGIPVKDVHSAEIVDAIEAALRAGAVHQSPARWAASYPTP